jgi:hypothetical protein
VIRKDIDGMGMVTVQQYVGCHSLSLVFVLYLTCIPIFELQEPRWPTLRVHWRHTPDHEYGYNLSAAVDAPLDNTTRSTNLDLHGLDVIISNGVHHPNPYTQLIPLSIYFKTFGPRLRPSAFGRQLRIKPLHNFHNLIAHLSTT